MDYPAQCIRGLRKPDDLTENGIVNGQAFYPSPKTAANRLDGCTETSINWYDDEMAIEFSLTNGEQAQYGLAILRRTAIDFENTRIQRAVLAYERNRLANNPYHGNIVFQAKLEPRLVKQLAASLALSAKHVPRPT